MTTKNYLLELSLECYQAIERLLCAIPCFLEKLEICDSYIELELRARAEDVKSVELRLAAYV